MMNNENWSFKPKDLVSVPNIITYVRFLLIAPFIYFFVKEQYIQAAVCVGLSGLSDCFDGYFARKLNQVTSLGKILDPIADKLTLFAVAVCMIIYMPSIFPVLSLLIFKEFLMLLCGFILLLRHITPPPAKWYGKIATIVFYVVVSVIIFLKAVFGYENTVLITIAFIVVAAVMIFALVMYAKIFIDLMRKK